MLRPMPFAALFLAAAQPAAAAELSVTIAGIRNSDGYVMAAVYDNPAGFPREATPVASVKLKARPGAIAFMFTGLAPARYAVSAFHDENGNGRLDANLLGIPTEGFGFSNDARGSMGPPKFEAAAVTVGEPGTAITVKLLY